ncbi:MAG: S9 family peptidase [Chitinophagaceae bacterium]|nr:S9 family peptidase [Rubrivivax sp.]
MFVRNPDLGAAKLSPSGRWLAVLAYPEGKRSVLLVLDLDTPGASKPVARFTDSDIERFEWVGDERLVFDLVDLKEGSGNRRFGSGLFSIGRDGQGMRQLVKLEFNRNPESARIDSRQLHPNHFLLHVPAGGGDEVIVGEWVLDIVNDLRSIVPKRLNVVDGRVRSIAKGSPDRTYAWLFDAAGEPRVAVARDKGRTGVHWRAPGQDGWAEIASFDALRATWMPRFVDHEGQLWVTATDGKAETAVLKRFDFKTGKPHDEAVVVTPGFDFTGNIVAETPGSQALGVRVETDAEQTVWFDDRLKRLQAEVDGKLPGLVNRLDCRRCAAPDMTVLVTSWSDREPGAYYVYRADKQTLQSVGRTRKDIEPARMARLDFKRITTRDGRDMPLWLTAPPGGKSATRAGPPLPAVVLVHGGPWVRGGDWRWDPLAQFLASRGYVVIEPEFRGSTGYGAVHFRAGWRQWGQAMQDDVADAVLWATEQGWADGKKVCIAGASYGGYATLMGLVRHPELYRCGAAWVAVTEPTLLFENDWRSDFSEEAKQYALPVLLGDPRADAAMLKANSPLAQADKIRAPLLLAFGELDRRVPLHHGTLLRSALRDHGRAPEWVVYDGEGHGWQTTESNIDFYRRLERFLAAYLR